ncbi:hypothetical protein ACJMK2_039612 [Sinanodonta woodiana]|uniref:Uncharacterized protein n=1 Tax=Sinanodonta woodiana TaxID=1069815 RepID=A0ABD3WCJ5_SINWO
MAEQQNQIHNLEKYFKLRRLGCDGCSYLVSLYKESTQELNMFATPREIMHAITSVKIAPKKVFYRPDVLH